MTAAREYRVCSQRVGKETREEKGGGGLGGRRRVTEVAILLVYYHHTLMGIGSFGGAYRYTSSLCDGNDLTLCSFIF